MVDFLWRQPHDPPRNSRGPKRALTLDQIADAAIAIADADGLAAVSMQRIAADLGFTKMSLYRYLPGKAELVAVMLERALGEPPELAGHGWRQALTEWAERLLERHARHPWTIEATAGVRPVGPNEMGWMERALAALPSGLTGAERMDAVATVAGHVRMIAGQSGGEAALTAAMGVVLRDHADRFPAVTAAVREAAEQGGGDQAFGFGLERILDGLAVMIEKRA